jgi:hypothetical protein
VGQSKDPTKDPRGVFERVAVEETTLVIELAEDAGIDTVNVVSPSGELYRRLAVYRGVTRLTADIDEAYIPGIYELLGVGQGQSVSSVQLEIAPRLAITDVSVASEGIVEFPDSLGTTTDAQIAVRVVNRGTGPGYIRKLLILGEVPNPTVAIADSRSIKSGILDIGSERFDANQVTLYRGMKHLFSNSVPFSTTRRDRYCGSEVYLGTAEVQLLGTGPLPLATTSFTVRYSPAESHSMCNIELLREA